LFYGRHLVQYFLSAPENPIRGPYHLQVTWLCLAWGGSAIIMHVALTRRLATRHTGYAVVAWDAILITLLCALSGEQTPRFVLFFVLIATAPLRLSIPLVWTTTACAVAGYLVQLGYYAWFVIGYERYYQHAELRVPRSHEAIVVLALLVSGLLAGQMVRQARRLVGHHPEPHS
jgi:hypothetical protein